MVERHDVAGVDLVLELGATSSPRTCSSCDAAATFYVYDADGVSTYRCADHLGDAVTDAGGDPDVLGDRRNGQLGDGVS